LRGDLDTRTAIGSERRLFVLERAMEAGGARRAPSLIWKLNLLDFIELREM
jgi:hypothetical protein